MKQIILAPVLDSQKKNNFGSTGSGSPTLFDDFFSVQTNGQLQIHVII